MTVVRSSLSHARVTRGSLAFAAFAVFSVLAVLFAASAAARVPEDGVAGKATRTSNVWIVQLKQEPVVAYEGTEAGFAATAVSKGHKLNRTDAKVQRYVAHLNDKHAAIANRVGASRIYDYDYAFNGFAAPLSRKQVAALRKNPDVMSVQRDQLDRVETDNTPTFLGLNAPGGLWSQLGGQTSAGTGVIVGVVDTGIWPEHPSFSPAGFGPPPATWHGTCQSGEQFSQSTCNNKLVGARYYLNGFGHFGVIGDDYKSARDADGHGTHTTSTAAGNANVQASILGSSLGAVSGMAPAARVAAYKACWNGEAGGCANTDTVAAIDDAVADGVDVINFSIGPSGMSTNYLDPTEVAFLMARRAGVFVASSAGNSGPAASFVAHISPWETSVAASTQNRSFEGTVTLGNNAKYTGVTLTGGLASTPLVDSAVAGSELCFTGALNPSVVSGKIVLCKRGTNARVEKSLAVKEAGGVGMILYNVSDTQSLNTDNHYVPALHINNTDGLAVKAYIAAAGAGATASLSGGQRVFGGGNTMADFSSRGPTVAGSRDVIKPDITAPGVNILAGNTPTAFLGAPGQLFQSISGTSMSSPHIAGIAAALTDLHPDWTPAEMQSAIMTSARQNVTLEDGSTPAGPFAFGAGHVVPNSAADPGLVYPADFNEYRAFLRSQGLCTLCFSPDGTPAPVKDPSDVNLPSIQIGALPGAQTVTRTVKNVGAAATYTVSVDEPAGVDVAVNPSELTLPAGASASYQVTFTTNRRATFDAYTTGAITWSDAKKGGHAVRIPVAVRPVQLAAPGELPLQTGASGSTDFTVAFGYSGTFSATAQGLQAAHTESRQLTDDPTNDFNTDDPQSNQGIQVHTFTVPANTPLARFQTFGTVNANDDLDMYVYRVVTSGGTTTRTLVGLSGGGTAAEVVTLNKPAAGTYEVYIHGWEVQSGVTYTLYDWILNPADLSNFDIVAPSTATSGTTATLTASWNSLTAGTKYLGRISYSNGSSEIGATIVRVDG